MEEFFSTKERELFLKLIKFYSETKIIIAYSEEVDADSKYNVQIWKELRDAFDHLMRAFTNKSEKSELDTDTYSLTNLEKSYAHVYRACYDAIEGSVFSLKKNILDIVCSYKPSQLVTIIPNYPDDRILIERINSKMAAYRNKKDIGRINNIDISELLDIIDQLKKLNEKYINLLPLLKDFCIENKKNTWKTILKNILYVFIGALITALLSWLIM